jgi:Pentapeptide repeats (8 copies)
VDLRHAKLRQTNLNVACLIGANLTGQILSGASFSKQNFSEANLSETDFSEAILSKANLDGANLRGANLSGADLSGANLNRTELIGTDISGADLSGSSIYGIAVWDVKLTADTRQENLIITRPGEAVITVDNIKVAQFIYLLIITGSLERAITVDNIKVAQFIHLLLKNQEIRDVIDTITSKAVMILGRFSEERKDVLDAIRNELRKYNYLPIMFDFPPSTNQATLETIKTLAGMSRFVIADITDARSVLQELQIIVPTLPSVTVRLLIKKSAHEYGMLDLSESSRRSLRTPFNMRTNKK